MKMRSRLTALVLAVLMLISTAAPALAADALPLSVYQSMVDSAADQATSQPVINEGGTLTDAATYIPQQKDLPIYESTTVQELSVLPAGSETVVTVALPQKGKVQLSVGTDGGQWQAQMLGQWINVSGDNGAVCDVTYAKIKSLLDLNGEARFRWLSADGQSVSEMAVFTLTASTQTVVEDEPAAAGEQLAERSSSPMMKTMSARSGETSGNTFSVVINYVFENNVPVADPYTATLAKGSDFDATVVFPKIQGYLPYLGTDTETSEKLDLNIKNIQADVTYTVTYKPTNVNYTVIHYWQNVDNDNYTEHERETLQGLTKSTVPDVDKKYPGFHSLLYEKPEIAADGSTVVEVYYDRLYYLMNFDMDGGYGTEPIYDRYGAAIGKVKEPTKEGYSFKGWTATEKGTDAVDLPKTMPAENRTYYAIWEADATAKVTLVFWGENEDDEEYSYKADQTKILYLKPGNEFTYNEEKMLVCDIEEHQHDSKCIACGKTKHTHTIADGCYELACTFSHTHSKACYPGALGDGISTNAILQRLPKDPVEGQVNEVWGSTYVYIDGIWYFYSGSVENNQAPTTCNNGNHTHDDACYKLICSRDEHTHSASCYDCGVQEHSHTSDCYLQGAGWDSTKWVFKKSDTVTVAADGSTIVNVYYDRVEYSVQFYSNQNCTNEYTDLKITAKWGASILSKWPTYKGSSSWLVEGKDDTWQNSIQTMPVGGAKFWGPKTGSDSYSAYYYVEVIPGESGTVHNGVTYKLHHTDISSSSGNVTDEERYAIKGFTFKEGTANGTSYNNAKFYYTRNSYQLTFNDGYNDVKSETVKYEVALSAYKDYVPDAPSAYEPGSVMFGGWYQNPMCTGEEYKLADHRMPANDVLLYAKWVPVNRTVSFYLDKAAYDDQTKLTTHPDVIVPHGSLVKDPIADPTNSSYKFIGWFYMENGEEKAFDFATMPVTKDLQVYGKWSSDVLKQYTVYFKLNGTDTEIADPITGSALAGRAKTFDAKGGEELYANYQEGYFPLVQSHTITLDIEDETKNTFTFWYVQKEAVPYSVYYVTEQQNEAGTLQSIELDGKTYYMVAETDVHSDNRKAVVTEQFKVVQGYVPDAYQKRLIINGTEGAVNQIIFVYTADTKHAYYKITHYTQNLDGQTWTEYETSQAQGDIGTRYTASAKEIDGFTYRNIEYVVNNQQVTEDITADGAKLTAQGLEINLYYVRNEYPYEVRYLEKNTGKELHAPKTSTGKYGQVISESAIDIDGYTAIDPTAQTLNIRIETLQDGETELTAHLNVITFYYTENEVTFNYIPVGPEGCGADGKPLATAAGTVDTETETVKVKTGLPVGSTATASSNVYKFVGWYSDAECTQPVDTSWLKDDGTTIVPAVTTTNDGETFTYYAKFEYNLTSLTIVKDGYAETASIDPNQTFIFKVTGGDLGDGIMVSINGDGSKTISGLAVGETYTVTEMESWSWRYDSDSSKSITLQPTGNTVTINNTREHIYWLDGNAVSETNVYGN